MQAPACTVCEVLASLNHPHIAAIYGLEKSSGLPALVMELVEGPTLADRIAQGAIPVDEVARTRAERLASGDPRPSLEERYGTHESYVAKVRAAAERLVRGRYLSRRMHTA